MSVESTYSVGGMTCGHCVKAVTAQFMRLPGIRTVDVDLASGEVRVNSDAALPIQDVRTAVDDAGYTLTEAHG